MDGLKEALERLATLHAELQAAIKAHRDATIARTLAETRYRQQRRLVVGLQGEAQAEERPGILQPPALQREPDGDVLWA